MRFSYGFLLNSYLIYNKNVCNSVNVSLNCSNNYSAIHKIQFLHRMFM